MMKVIRLALFWLAACSPAFAQVGQIPTYLQPAPSGGACSQATSFLARTSGLDATHQTAYTTMICGLVTDGVWAKLDVLHIYGTQDATNALLNLVSSSFPATLGGTPTFTANQGFLGNLSPAAYISTGFNPSTAGGHWTQNSASMGLYNRTSPAAAYSTPIMGAWDGSNQASYYNNAGSNDFYFRLDEGFSSQLGVQVTHAGFFIGTRNLASGAGAINVYKNGTSLYTGTAASTGIPNKTLLTLNWDQNGTPSGGIPEQCAADFMGGGLTATDASNLSTRVNNFFTTFLTNVY